LFQKYNTDVYIQSWDVNEYSINDSGILRGITEPTDIASIIRLYQPYLKDFNFQDWENYKNNRFPNLSFLDRHDDVFKINDRAIHHGSFYVERIRDQWTVVKNAWEMIVNPYEYDIIVRLRFDIILDKIELTNNEFVIPVSDISYKTGVEYCDYMAYGNPKAMDKYCHLVDNIESIYVESNFDISHAEKLLKFYMEEFKNPIVTNIDNSISYKLLKK
jgi:hypothetical protein